MVEHETHQNALYERFSESAPWYVLSQKNHISIGKLRRAYRCWQENLLESQPLSPRDMHFSSRPKGRPLLIQPKHEAPIIASIRYYAKNNTPLSKPCVRELIRTYVEMLCFEERQSFDLGEHGPPDSCINNLMEHNGLKYTSVQVVEDKRLNAFTPSVCSEHIARIQSAIDRYGIRDPQLIFITDQSGSSFRRMCGRSLRKGFGMKDKKLQQTGVRTKGQLERVTVMPYVSASGKAYKPVIVFPGIRPHFRKVKGVYQKLHSVLPECYLHYREIPGFDSAIIYDWDKHFLEETKELRKNRQHMLLILDGYSTHVQFPTLNLFRQNRAIVIAFPAHTSHRLQPLDVSVFNSYKSFLQSFLHVAARVRSVFNDFDLGSIITLAYENSLTRVNIQSGFEQCGIWDFETMGTNVQKLQHFFDDMCSNGDSTVTVEALIKGFFKKGRSLLRDATVEQEGTVKISTRNGAHLTCDTILEALNTRKQKKNAKAAKNLSLSKAFDDFNEPRKALEHYAKLADRRFMQRKRLRENRNSRRVRQKHLFCKIDGEH